VTPPSRPGLGAGLEGRGVLVTGAAGGIGAAVVRCFAECGARVVACDLPGTPLDELVASLAGEGHAAAAVDVADLTAHETLIAEAERASGGLVALAHLAAVIRRRHDVPSITEADWDAQLDVNLKAGFFLGRAFAEHLKLARRPGAVVNFSSQGWWTGGFGGSVVYNAAKGGVVSMTRGLARSYAPDGIRFNAVAPGLVDTAMLRDGMSDEALDRLVEQVPQRRLGAPEEIAPSVVFLASDHARYITGATLNVSGGFLMY
jgi:NAD(P)-dependent dehydrogenase (short-subunit alcohol dehydrogenase family)